MKLFCFGLGFSARALLRLVPEVEVVATARTETAADGLKAAGIVAISFDGTAALPPSALDGVTHILSSVPPDEDGDPVVRCAGSAIRASKDLHWVGYLSTTGVYGDRQGGWVDETGALRPAGRRGERRVTAEHQWSELLNGLSASVQIFRLAGIYGSGRNQFNALRNGTARRIVKQGQVFSRIHVDDIAAVLKASIERPRDGGIYNVCDDLPAPPDEVVAYAAELLDMPPPPAVPFEDAELSPMGRSFYGESKRVSNRLIKEELGIELRFPSYREGLPAVLDAENAEAAAKVPL